MWRASAVIVIAMSSIAAAKPHRNAGTYRVKKTKPSPMVTGDAPSTPTKIPACKPERPVPTDITILYRGPERSSVSVNGELWINNGLTVEYYTKRVVPHARILTRPSLPGTKDRTSVWFRRDNDRASALYVVHYTDEHDARCVTAYEYEGSFTP